MEGGKLENSDFILAIMDRLEFFSLFTNFEKRRLVNFYRHIFVCEAGEVIIREAEEDSCFYVILSGLVRVTKGKTLTIAELGPGEIFGEVSFLAETPRTATVTAMEETILIEVNEGLFEKLDSETREKIKDNIIAKLIERLTHMNNALHKSQSKLDGKVKKLIILDESSFT